MDELRLQGFKCFLDKRLELNNVTILTGNNGAGKSSVIQALLLVREAVEKCASRDGDSWKWLKKEIALNEYRQLQLGRYDELCHYTADGICISVNGVDFRVEQNEEASDGFVTLDINLEKVEQLPSFLQEERFYYLNAERIGPRRESQVRPMAYLQSGDCGEWSGNVLLEASRTFPKVDVKRLVDSNDPVSFNVLVDKWMSYIFSEMSVKSEPITTQVCQIKLRGSKVTTNTPNTGFGYTYALPIVIDGLLAKEGCLLIVENPEAHLHPKAQSNIGYFLGKMAAAGVKIVIETHSEHVVNGIRRAALSGFGLNPEDVNIYFFMNDTEGCDYRSISIKEDGSLSDFPVDFFDQVRQDMLEIIRLAAKRG